MIYPTDKTMNLFFTYTKEEIDKIGNTIIYLSEKIPLLSKTKALKLIYLIEETSVKKFGLPILNLKFFVWMYGPVTKDIFIDLSSNPILLNEYIKREERDGNSYISPNKAFSDDEFSDNEMAVIDLVIDTFKNYTAEQLVKLTHREHSLWYKTAKENNVLDLLENKQLNNTEIEIDFSRLLEGDDYKKEIYLQHREFLNVSRSLKL